MNNKKILEEIRRFRQLSNLQESAINEDLINNIRNLDNKNFLKETNSIGSYSDCSGTYSYHCKSKAIATVQDCLGGLVIDGKFGPKTRAALEKIGFTSFTDEDVDEICRNYEGSNTSTDDDSDIELGNISSKGQELLDNEVFQKKLQEISDAIHIDKKYIIKLMNHESGLDPKAENSIGCVGLIQFCPSGGSTRTANGKSYSLDVLKNDLSLQMEAIKDFWLSGYNNGKIKKPEDLYIYNFFPIAAGKPDDFVLQTKNMSAKTIANANPVFNRELGKERSSPLTVGDLNDFYQKTGMV
jgi:hypothetical protein